MSISQNSVILDTLAKRNKQLLETGKYSDFIIECGGRQFKVHRSIVCPQSKFLEILCESNFEVILSPAPSSCT
jgi:BTB/POZ domain